MQKEFSEEWHCLAGRYEIADFIKTDPIQFPHRYHVKQDIEISAFISAWLAYGSRQVFIPLLDEIHCMMGASPREFILNRIFDSFAGNEKTLYRFCKWRDLHEVCSLLHSVYSSFCSMEDWLVIAGEPPLHTLQKKFGHIPQLPVYNGSSACKKLHMFLRWMIRRNSPVDFGIWEKFEPKDLSVPVDTHVLQQARLWGITNRKQADKKQWKRSHCLPKQFFLTILRVWILYYTSLIEMFFCVTVLYSLE
ncbi:MAG: TIGR02757 family protein [Tannerellaceae bacterium]|nr:TIGR02757 family protein [Tannerellaceae bacterium]